MIHMFVLGGLDVWGVFFKVYISIKYFLVLPI